MNLDSIIGLNWSIYINGWFYHRGILFLEDGRVDNSGAEGFSTWSLVDDYLVISDELGDINYRLKYIEDAKIWLSVSNYRKTNNNILLALSWTKEELLKIKNDQIFALIANKSASYKGEGGDVWGYLFFGADGRIYNYHHENESYWVVENNRLFVLNKAGEKKLQSISILNSSQDFTHIIMEQIGGSDRHYISFTQDKNYGEINPKQHLKMDTSFSNANDVLMIVFNSAGSEYNGYDSKYEFFKMPFAYPVDYIRVAQSAPTRYYLDDMNYIKSIASLKKYKKVVCIGMSIGGYAAMWLSEFLSEDDNQTIFYSIAIQAMSSLDFTYSKLIRSQFSDKYKKRAKTLNSQRLYDYQNLGKKLDIADFLTVDKKNVVHHCLFDGLSEFESSNILRLNTSRVKPMAIPLNVDHMDGCNRIGSSGMIEKILDRIILEK